VKIHIAFAMIFAVCSLCFAFNIIELHRNGVTFLYAKEFAISLQSSQTALISRHIDGDTVEVRLNEKVKTLRVIGLDTPESVHPQKEVEYFARAASLFTKILLEKDDMVFLTFQYPDLLDRYQRLLAHVWYYAFDNSNEPVLVSHSLVLVLNGYGRGLTSYRVDEPVRDFLLQAERYARENSLGLWGKIDENMVLQNLKSGFSTTPVSVGVYVEYKGQAEKVFVINLSDIELNLKGWKIESYGGQSFIFPDFVLKPRESVVISSGPKAAGTFIWTKAYVWNNSGDEARVYDQNGELAGRYFYPMIFYSDHGALNFEHISF